MIAERVIKIKSATTMAGCRREPQAESGHGVAQSRSPGCHCHSDTLPVSIINKSPPLRRNLLLSIEFLTMKLPEVCEGEITSPEHE